MCVCVRESVCERECVCVRERERVCVCVREREVYRQQSTDRGGYMHVMSFEEEDTCARFTVVPDLDMRKRRTLRSFALRSSFPHRSKLD